MIARILIASTLLTGSASAADWVQFRGPNASGVGIAKGLPETWTSTENIVWKTKLAGPGTSCPIVVGNKIFLTCYTGYGIEPGEGDMKDLMRHVVCIDRVKGEILWTKDFKPVLPESKYTKGNDSEHGYASSTIACDGKNLFVFFGKSGVYCLDMDGKEIWNTSVGTKTSGWGSSNSPVLYKDVVIVNASIESGNLVGLDKTTGKELWQTKGISASWNTPVLVETPDGVECVLSESKAVIGFDPATGKELWRVTGFGGYVCPSVVAHKNIVYVVRNKTLAIKAGGRGDVTETHVLWTANGGSLVPSPVYFDGKLYNGSDRLNAETGKSEGKAKLSKGGSFYASPTVADDKLFWITRTSGIYVLSTGAEYKQLAFNTFEDDKSRSNASPIVHDGCILLRTDKYLYCIGKSK